MNSTASTASVAAAPDPATASIEMIRRLIAFQTVSRDSNLGLIEWTRDYLRCFGAETTLTYDDTRLKANLFATLPAQDGNTTRDGLVLSGHSDVVPVDGQPWDTNPFEVVQKDDRLVGRGVADMKSFAAIALSSVPQFVQRGLKRPLHFSLSYDEELGCIGVQRLIADIVKRGIRPAGCIIGEPTGMRVVVAHKGKMSWRCRERGHEAHSALTPRGVNAVEIACDIVAHIAHRAREYREHGLHDAAFDVPYTTVQAGVIRGGTAVNIIPRDCSFDFEIRHLPGDDPRAFFADVKAHAEGFLPAMRAIDSSTHIEFDQLSTLPAFVTAPDSPLAALGLEITGAREVAKVSFGSEASWFDAAQVPTILCGPGRIEQAHQPNEWIGLDQLARCQAFMSDLADRLCTA